MTQQQAGEIVAEAGIQDAMQAVDAARDTRWQLPKQRIALHAAIMRAKGLCDTSRRDALPAALAEQVKAVMAGAK